MSFVIENDLLIKAVPETGEKSVCVPDGIVSVGQRAFADCKLEEVILPKTVKKIEAGAFMDCTELREIILPETVTAVYNEAFSGCASLQKLTLPAQLLHCGENVCRACASLKTIASNDGSVIVTCEDPEKTGIVQTAPEDYTNQSYIGLMLGACVNCSCLVTVRSAETGEDLYKLYVAFDRETDELRRAVRELFSSSDEYDFSTSDSYFRSMRGTKNKSLYAYLRLKYPYELAEEYAILFRNFLRRFATATVAYFIEDGRPEAFAYAEQLGVFEKADMDELRQYAQELSREDIAELLDQIEARREKAGASGVGTLTPQQIRSLNEPVFRRLQEKKARLRRAAEERIAHGRETLVSLLMEAARADDRSQVRKLLAEGMDRLDEKTILEACSVAIENDDSHMLQDFLEVLPALSPELAAEMLENAVISGNESVVKFLCVYAAKINPYNRALGYALRQASFEMAKAILSRDDQMLKTAAYIKEIFKQLGSGARELKSRLVDVQYLDYNYYDDDFRYLLLNNYRNGLIGDQFYDMHYTLVKLADIDKRIEFIRQMAKEGLFKPLDLEYICFLAVDSDEIPIAQAALELGVEDLDVKKCSRMANHVTVLQDIGDLLTSNPKRPSDEKFFFILGRLKGEKLRLKRQYLLMSADIARTLELLKHSSLEMCEDVPGTVDYFVRHGSAEGVEILCQWGLDNECFESAQRQKKTELVAWVLDYKNKHTKRENLEDRFSL